MLYVAKSIISETARKIYVSILVLLILATAVPGIMETILENKIDMGVYNSWREKEIPFSCYCIDNELEDDLDGKYAFSGDNCNSASDFDQVFCECISDSGVNIIKKINVEKVNPESELNILARSLLRSSTMCKKEPNSGTPAIDEGPTGPQGCFNNPNFPLTPIDQCTVHNDQTNCESQNIGSTKVCCWDKCLVTGASSINTETGEPDCTDSDQQFVSAYGACVFLGTLAPEPDQTNCSFRDELVAQNNLPSCDQKGYFEWYKRITDAYTEKVYDGLYITTCVFLILFVLAQIFSIGKTFKVIAKSSSGSKIIGSAERRTKALVGINFISQLVFGALSFAVLVLLIRKEESGIISDKIIEKYVLYGILLFSSIFIFSFLDQVTTKKIKKIKVKRAALGQVLKKSLEQEKLKQLRHQLQQRQ